MDSGMNAWRKSMCISSHLEEPTAGSGTVTLAKFAFQPSRSPGFRTFSAERIRHWRMCCGTSMGTPWPIRIVVCFGRGNLRGFLEKLIRAMQRSSSIPNSIFQCTRRQTPRKTSRKHSCATCGTAGISRRDSGLFGFDRSGNSSSDLGERLERANGDGHDNCRPYPEPVLSNTAHAHGRCCDGSGSTFGRC